MPRAACCDLRNLFYQPSMTVTLSANAQTSANHRGSARQVSAPLGRASRLVLPDGLFLSSANALAWTTPHGGAQRALELGLPAGPEGHLF